MPLTSIDQSALLHRIFPENQVEVISNSLCFVPEISQRQRRAPSPAQHIVVKFVLKYRKSVPTRCSIPMGRSPRGSSRTHPRPSPRSPALQLFVNETEEAGAALPEGSRPATESLLHTLKIAEGLFDVSRTHGRHESGTHQGNANGNDYDKYVAKLALPEGQHADAFDVRNGATWR